MKISSFTLASILAMTLALGLALRIFSQHQGFETVVEASRESNEGYDQRFIDLVNHMEDLLAKRAGFAYPGGKDPMTGRRREVALSPIDPSPRRITAIAAQSKAVTPKNKAGGPKSPAKPDSSLQLPPTPPPDNVKLTAIIADDYGQHTAIVMDGERSLSVDVGDMVGNRKVTKVTSKDITLEDDSAIYGYDLSGNRSYQKK